MHCPDQECLKRAKEDGKNVVLVEAPVSSDAMKCVLTDTDCLKRAKQAGKKIEIVDEPELAGDTLRCASTDSSCLKRAKALGQEGRDYGLVSRLLRCHEKWRRHLTGGDVLLSGTPSICNKSTLSQEAQ